MTTDIASAPSSPHRINRIATSDVFAALAEGWADFRHAPLIGLAFALPYVIAGLIVYLQLQVWGQTWWILPIAVGFPLVAPFAAVGLYEVSRRLEAGLPLDWGEIFGVVIRQKDRQIPSMAAVVIVFFLFWIYAAHLVFALFLGLKPMTNIMSSVDVFLTPTGLIMLLVGTIVGAALATALYAITVVALPMLLHREVDFVTAMIASVGVCLQNPMPMLLFGLVVSGVLFAGMIPVFLGLFIVLPLLGHATWRLYRRAISYDDD
ncbi:MAG: DUF2189 domain-containing protein [Pseudomonadota bacterium]